MVLWYIWNLVNPAQIADILGVDPSSEVINAFSGQIIIRDKTLPIEKDQEKYIEKGIKITSLNNPEDGIDIASAIRYLFTINPDLFYATEEEIKKSLPNDLPLLMRIDNWHYKEYYVKDGQTIGAKPSSYETFSQIAKVLVAADTSIYNPTLPANNDWKHWENFNQY